MLTGVLGACTLFVAHTTRVAPARAPQDRGVAATATLRLSASSRAAGGMIAVSTPGARVEVRTTPGVAAARVAAGIAVAVNGSAAFRGRHVSATARGDTVFFTTPTIYACSAESDLGVPPPPRAVRCDWDTDERSVVFRWENPRTYDRVLIVDEDGVRINASAINGSATSYRHALDRDPTTPAAGRKEYGVVGVTNGIGCLVRCVVHIAREVMPVALCPMEDEL